MQLMIEIKIQNKLIMGKIILNYKKQFPPFMREKSVMTRIMM